jgi:amidase
MASLSPFARGHSNRVPGNAKLTKMDCLTITAAELQDLLTARKVTSVTVVESYIEQISRHNNYLRAVLEICPTAMQQAKRLDEERRKGRVRGPLHGIPVLIKVNQNR